MKVIVLRKWYDDSISIKERKTKHYKSFWRAK
jgi:hypothetical protein